MEGPDSMIHTFISSRCRGVRFLAVLACLCCYAPAPAAVQTEEKYYYWLTPRFGPRDESFVVEVNAAIKAQIEELFAQNHEVGVRGRISAEAAPYNKNYNRPGQPVWNWHFVAVEDLRDFTRFPIDTTDINPNRDDPPSRIAADPQEWIRVHGNAYFPKDFHINREVRPSEKDAVANVSNRGVAGVGERTLITGLIITGGEPRNVVVRAIGPSLAQHGVRQFAANPKLEVYRGSSRIAMNDNWQDDPRANSLGALAPGNNNEAAMLLTLLPGSYTLHGINEEGTEGMILLEAYDVDSGSE